jgi:phosphoribosylamine-glycine ligase
MKFVIITWDAYPLPIAKHLLDEKREVTVAIVKDREDLGLKEKAHDEKPEERRQRLSTYDGMLKKATLARTMAMLERVTPGDRDDYFFFFDFNEMYNISEAIMKMGFRNGLFPTEFYYRMERERDLAKDYVEKNYGGKIRVPETKDFKKAQDGVNFINESDSVWVLKSNGNVGKTVVPCTDDPDLAKEILVSALTDCRKDYEGQGYILEEKIIGAMELTPVLVCYNGEPVYTLVELENKAFGSGNIGPLKGGNQALSIRTSLDCKINEIAFPPAIYALAKKQPGLSIFDAGLLYDGKGFYFTEFCAMRYGWDGILSELVMRDDGEPFVANYFEDLVKKRSPLKRKYGVSVRLFNYKGGYEDTGRSDDDIPIVWYQSVNNNLFLYNVKEKDDAIVSVGGCDYLGGMTGSSDMLESAVNKTYKGISKICFESLYYRPKFDFLSTDYSSSIMNRLEAIKEFI